MAYNIVLIEPEIPNNTGTIGRLALGANAILHLVKPYGFEITDTRLKRAGLDYWQHITLIEYNSVEEFFEINKDKKMVFFSSHGEKTFWTIDFEDDLFLVFGKESVGLSNEIIEAHPNQIYTIPMHSDKIRSLNLGNAVGIVLYEGLRQKDFKSK